jgi:hypothetical protein
MVQPEGAPAGWERPVPVAVEPPGPAAAPRRAGEPDEVGVGAAAVAAVRLVTLVAAAAARVWAEAVA